MAPRLSRFASRRSIALALALGLVGAGVGVVAAGKPVDCRTTIAGTYYKPADVMVTLSPDGSLVGQLSATVQATAAGVGQSFSGAWKCSGLTVTTEEFRFYKNETGTGFSQGEATGTFSAANNGTLVLTYTFHFYEEAATAAEIRAHSGFALPIDPITMERISTP